MNRWSIRLLLITVCVLALPYPSPAPLIYTPGEGWTYEAVGGEGNWRRTRAKDQLVVAQDAFDKKDYGTARKAARRVVQVWPLSDYAPQAQYLIGRCYESKGLDERAFNAYQTLIEKYPKAINYEEVLKRQYEIANRFLAGEWFRLWTYIPFFPSMDRTAGLFDKIVKNGPYSDIAPLAQMKIGAAREKEKTLGIRSPDYSSAVQAYELAADRYYDQPKVASEAIYRAGFAYERQAQSGERDQTTAGQAIAKFTDFMALYPNDSRVPEAQQTISRLRSEQARGNFVIAKYYQKHKKWEGARIYYNEVLLQDPNSPYATEARQRIDQLKQRPQGGGR